MNYPMDTQTFSETIQSIVDHNKMQEVLVEKMATILESAMDTAETDAYEWYSEAETILKDRKALQTYHESRRFNEDNFRQQFGYEPTQRHAKAIERLNDVGVLQEFEHTEAPAEEGGEYSEEELAKIFKEKRKTKVHAEPVKTLKNMSLEEIEEWEAKQDNSNDIYKIKARVANLARGPGMSLTPQGEQLCNTFVHVLKSFYDFAEKIEDKTIKIKLTELIRSHETMPGVLIAAAGAGVTQVKGKHV